MGEVRADAMALLGKSAGWLRFLAILSYLFAAAMFFAAAVLGPVIREFVLALANLGIAVMAFLAGFGVVCLVCGIKMWNYASAIRRLQAGQMLPDFEAVMERQASLWVTVAAMIGVTILLLVGFSVFLLATMGEVASVPA